MSRHLQFKMQSALQIALCCCLSLFVLVRASWSQGGIPADQLARLKAATVLVLVNAPGEEDSGSGFLIAKDAQFGYIATNEHVIDTDTKQGRSVQVVLNSGVPGAELVRHADIVAEDDSRDLAILRVSSDKLPAPIPLSSPQPPRETAQVWVFGFPFGEMLATSKLHPSVTITTGTITSLRLDDYGKITRVQVDADVNEGNSGGPIVDATGALVGIATEKVEDTKIGLGLPPSELEEMLQGRVRESGMNLISVRNGVATYNATAVLIDPLSRVRSVTAFFLPQEQAPHLKPDAQGRYRQLSPTMSAFPLTAKGNEYSSTVIIKSTERKTLVFWEQIRLELANGQFKWTQPVPVAVPFTFGVTSTPSIGGNSRAANPASNAPTNKDGDWLGAAAVPQVGASTPGGVPQPITSNRLLLGDPQNEAGANYRQVNVGGRVTPTMLWSNDGKFLYLLEPTGVLHKVAVPDFREEKVLSMQQQTAFMTLSRAGLAIGLPLLQEVWLVSPDTLQITKRIPVGEINRLTGSPALNFVYALQVDTLSVVDLVAGKVTAQLRAKEFSLPGATRGNDLGDFFFATITPDGKYLMSGNDNLNRLRIGDNGTSLTYEEAGPDIGSNTNPQRLEISSDSRYVALTCGGGNNTPNGHPQMGPYGTYIYKITDLQTPVLAITAGAYPDALGFDKVAGYIYAQNFSTPLMVYTASGLKQKTFFLRSTNQSRGGGFGGGFGRNVDIFGADRYGFGGKHMGNDSDQFLPHPSGRKLLVLNGSGLTWVELPSPDKMATDDTPAQPDTPFGGGFGQPMRPAPAPAWGGVLF